MTVIVPERPVRYRPKLGEPRCRLEAVAQWIWRWRTELMLAYLVASVVTGTIVALLIELRR